MAFHARIMFRSFYHCRIVRHCQWRFTWYSWQAQHLVMLDGHFSSQGPHLVMMDNDFRGRHNWGWRAQDFWWFWRVTYCGRGHILVMMDNDFWAGAILVLYCRSLFLVAGATFGDAGQPLFVGGATFWWWWAIIFVAGAILVSCCSGDVLERHFSWQAQHESRCWNVSFRGRGRICDSRCSAHWSGRFIVQQKIARRETTSKFWRCR